VVRCHIPRRIHDGDANFDVNGNKIAYR